MRCLINIEVQFIEESEWLFSCPEFEESKSYLYIESCFTVRLRVLFVRRQRIIVSHNRRRREQPHLLSACETHKNQTVLLHSGIKGFCGFSTDSNRATSSWTAAAGRKRLQVLEEPHSSTNSNLVSRSFRDAMGRLRYCGRCVGQRSYSLLSCNVCLPRR